MNQITLRNSDGATWTSGNRGKPPAWVASHPDYIAFKAQKGTEVASAPVAVGPQTDARLKFWKWIGLEDFKATAQCVVAAHSRTEAIRELNKVFKTNPVSVDELERMWTLIHPDEYMPQTVGTYEFKEGSWMKR